MLEQLAVSTGGTALGMALLAFLGWMVRTRLRGVLAKELQAHQAKLQKALQADAARLNDSLRERTERSLIEFAETLRKDHALEFEKVKQRIAKAKDEEMEFLRSELSRKNEEALEVVRLRNGLTFAAAQDLYAAVMILIESMAPVGRVWIEYRSGKASAAEVLSTFDGRKDGLTNAAGKLGSLVHAKNLLITREKFDLLTQIMDWGYGICLAVGRTLEISDLTAAEPELDSLLGRGGHGDGPRAFRALGACFRRKLVQRR